MDLKVVMVGMIFKREPEPKHRVPYAVQNGHYVGEMFVYIEKDEKNFYFLSIPKNVNREVPKDRFFFGLENKILEEVDKLPSNIYSLLKAQYFYNKKRETK